MAAHGLAERRATLAKMKTINAGRVWQGTIPDDEDVPRDTAGRVLPHAVIDFGAPVQLARDRNLAYGEKRQPHALPGVVTCIAGTADDAQALMAAYFDLLIEWKPSLGADPWEAKGGYGSKRPATESTPTRYMEVLFLEAGINVDPDQD